MMLTTTFITLAWLDLVPMWLVMLTVGRDLVIVSGALAYRVALGTVKIAPKISSKINTAAQLGFVLIVICRQAFSFPAAWVATAAGAAVLVLTLVSGTDYVLTYSLRARAELRARGYPR